MNTNVRDHDENWKKERIDGEIERARWSLSHRALMHFGDISQRGVIRIIILPISLVTLWPRCRIDRQPARSMTRLIMGVAE